jgi:hypothetical protein
MDRQGLEKYLPHLEGDEMSEEDKMEFLAAVYKVVECFLDVAHSEDPIHIAMEEKLGKLFDEG